MRVLVACEYSGRVRDAFIALGHEAISCDLLPTESPGPHYQGDIRDILDKGFDLMVAHPPCTYLCAAGAQWWQDPRRQAEQVLALDFVRLLLNAPIHRIAIENPIGAIGTHIRPPDQVIQPYDFGEPISKKTCLWLKNLQPLVPTQRVDPGWVRTSTGEVYRDNKGQRYSQWHYVTGKRNGHLRSLTPQGVAQAMAAQWSSADIYCFT